MDILALTSVEIRLLVHSTEDDEKIIKRLSEISLVSEENFEKKSMIGHFKNPIILVRGHLTGIQAEDSIKEIFRRIKKSEKKILSLNMMNQIDEHGKLYLRIDKQSIFSKKLKLSENDPIRIKIKPRIKDMQKVIQMYHSIIKEG
jgi:RNA binding exosome subunit